MSVSKKIIMDPPRVACRAYCVCGAKFNFVLYLDIHDKIPVMCSCGRTYTVGMSEDTNQLKQLRGSRNE